MGDEIFELATRLGMWVVPGISCCDAWQHWKHWSSHTLDVATRSIASQVLRTRGHASALAFWYSSDELPPPVVEKRYLAVFAEFLWPNALLASASNLTSTLTHENTGVKVSFPSLVVILGVSQFFLFQMSGPYRWVPPVFWYQSTVDSILQGGAFGFLSEGGPGQAPMTYESLTSALVDLWPLDNADWMYHNANPAGLFGRHDYFSSHLAARYGTASNAKEYSHWAQVASYESYRAFFESYNVNQASLVSWMLQAGRPQNQWHLIEYNGMAGGAYFGVKLANEPVHALLEPDANGTFSVVSVMSLGQLTNIQLTVRVYDLSGNNTFSHYVSFSGPRIVRDVARIPASAASRNARFVELVVSVNASAVSRNVYWLPAIGSEDVFDWSSDQYNLLQSANLTAFVQLPRQAVNTKDVVIDGAHSSITISNPGPGVVFFLRLRLVDQNEQDVVPSLWSNNFLTLFTGQEVSVVVDSSLASSKPAKFLLDPLR